MLCLPVLVLCVKPTYCLPPPFCPREDVGNEVTEFRHRKMSVVVLQLENTESRWNWVGQSIRAFVPFYTFVGSVGLSNSLIIPLNRYHRTTFAFCLCFFSSVCKSLRLHLDCLTSPRPPSTHHSCPPPGPSSPAYRLPQESHGVFSLSLIHI